MAKPIKQPIRVLLIERALELKVVGERENRTDALTVRHHRPSILNRLDLSDRFEPIIYTYRHKLAVCPNSSPPP